MELNDDVAVVKLIPLFVPMESNEPGVVEPTPSHPAEVNVDVAVPPNHAWFAEKSVEEAWVSVVLPETVNDVSVPRDVSDEAVTPDASVPPVSVPAGAITATVPAAVIRPFPFTVKVGIAVDEPHEPLFVLTVASVVASDPAVVVISPVRAGNCDAWSVPVTSARLIFSVEVATHCGTPDAEVVRIDELADASVLSTVEPEPYTSEFDASDDRPVPPFGTVSADASVSDPFVLNVEVAVEPKYAERADSCVEVALVNC